MCLNDKENVQSQLCATGLWLFRTVSQCILSSSLSLASATMEQVPPKMVILDLLFLGTSCLYVV